MNYYDLIKEYGTGKGEKTMWATTKIVSDFLRPMKDAHPEMYWKLIKDTYAAMCGPHFNENFAMWQIGQMYYKDKKGETHHGARWTKEQYKATYDAVKSKLKSSAYNIWDWAVTLEMLAHDNMCLYKEWWPNISDADLDAKFIDAAINYLNDDDDPEGKIWHRFNG